ncbi:MAG TPA: hypothetical protein VG370_34895 [Chloroflexota bacterium]|jgi:hypothetical protein|nr:hypothetical protein [Chloroflexota bacterium]
MPWGRWDDQLYDNGKVMSFSDKAYRLWGNSISYANRHHTHGYLTEDQALYLVRAIKGTRRTIAELVAKRGWDRDGDGYAIHDFAQYNDKADPTAADRAARYRANGRAGRDAHPDGDRDASVTATVTPSQSDRDARHDPVPVPVPVPRPREEEPASHALIQVRGGRGDEPERERDGPEDLDQAGAALGTALVDALGFAPNTRGEKSGWDAAIGDLLAADPPVSPEEVPRLVERYRAAFTVGCTPRAIGKHLGELRSARDPPSASDVRPADWGAQTYDPDDVGWGADLPRAPKGEV